MIEEISGRPEGMLEFKVTGKVTEEDYDNVLTPALERALKTMIASVCCVRLARILKAIRSVRPGMIPAWVCATGQVLSVWR